MKMQYVVYNDSNSTRVKVEVTGGSLDECEAAALATPGVNKIAWARILEGNLGAVKSHAKVIADSEKQ